MKAAFVYPCVLLILLSAATYPLHGRSKKLPAQSVVTVTPRTALPVITSGPGKIVVRYVNPLHFHYWWQVSSTNITAPTPPSVIAPSSSISGTLPGPTRGPAVNPPPPPQHAAGQPPTIDQLWANIWDQLKSIRETTFGLKQQADTMLFMASMEQQCYKDRLSFYASFFLDDHTADTLKQFAINNRKPVTSGNSSTSPSDSCRRIDDTWPFDDLQDDEKQIYFLQAALFDFTEVPDFAKWKATAPNGDNYTAVSNAVSNLLTQVQGLESSADVAKNFQAAQVYNHFWRQMVENIARSEDEIATASSNLQGAQDQLKKNPQDANLKSVYQDAQTAYEAAEQRSPLQQTINVACDTNWYGRGRTDTITLHYTDNTVASPPDQNTPIATSVCLTPGTVSTGIGMSFLRNRQFAFVSGRDPNNPANTISVIGTTTDQQITPLYDVQYNIALRDFMNGWGLHAAVGAALGSSSGTTNIELIAGPSISIKRRAFFVTPAFQLGRRDNLLPGYKIGDPQGNGLTSIPVHTSWQPGFALTFSFSVAQ